MNFGVASVLYQLDSKTNGHRIHGRYYNQFIYIHIYRYIFLLFFISVSVVTRLIFNGTSFSIIAQLAHS